MCKAAKLITRSSAAARNAASGAVIANAGHHGTLAGTRKSGLNSMSVIAWFRQLHGALVCAAVVFIPQFAQAQLTSGTLIVFQLRNNKFMLAADSRGELNGVTRDTNCKVAAFRQKVIFAVAGVPFYPPRPFDPAPAWNSVIEAGKAIVAVSPKESRTSQSRVNAIADRWAKNMRDNWRTTDRFHHDLVAQEQGGNLTVGVFAATSHGTVSFTTRFIVLDKGKITILPDDQQDCSAHPCAAGHSDILKEYYEGKTQRATNDFRTYKLHEPLPKGTSPEMARIIWLVDLAATYEPTRTIGLPVDALELSGDGHTRWVQGYRKKQCPETQE